MIFGFIIGSLLLILSAILLTGKGGFLVAGYNTAPKEEQAKFNAKKLSRAAGIMLLLITAATTGLFLIPFTSVYSTFYLIFFFVFIVADIAVFMYFANNKCKNEVKLHSSDLCDTEYLRPAAPKKRRVKQTVFTLIVCAVPIIVVIPMLIFAGKPTVFTVGNGQLDISTSYGQTVPLSDIESVTLINTLPKDLSKKNGINMGSILKGHFTAGGEALTVYVNASKPPFIELQTKNGTILLNDGDKAKTQALFDKIKTATGR